MLTRAETLDSLYAEFTAVFVAVTVRCAYYFEWGRWVLRKRLKNAWFSL